MGLGIFSGGGAGEAGNWKGYSLTTNATPDTESNTAFDQVIYEITIANDGSDDIDFGFGVSTTTKSFTVKVGEVLVMEIIHKTLYYKSASASQSFRVLVRW